MMHPLLQDLLYGVARTGVRAGVSALDSILDDVEAVTEEATSRVKRARGKIRKIRTIRARKKVSHEE